VPTAETVLGADNTWFLMRERLSGKKNARFKEPSLPKGFRPRGGADAAPRAPLDRHRAFSPRVSDRSQTLAVSLLRGEDR
jgi:hypothetical protein